jgi:hypothetical protein
MTAHVFITTLLATFAGAPEYRAEELRGARPTKELSRFCLLLEPSFMRPPLFKKIVGAKRTGLVPAYETIAGIRYYTATEYRKLGITWSEFKKRSVETAGAYFKGLKPELITDQKGEIMYAKIESESHLTAATVLAPELFSSLKEALGTKMLILAPSRFRIYIFPRASSDFQQWGKRILREYDEATYPATYEVLELSKDSIRCIGSFRTE